MFVTTAINYTNGDPHIGHCYEAILADVIVRYRRLFSTVPVFFQTGTDEHGQKIAEKAVQQNMTPIQLCDFYAKKFKVMDEQLHIGYDHFIRTTDDYHKKEVIRLFNILKNQGDIYLGSYVGWYNTREETFVTEHDAVLTKYMDPVSNLPLQKITEPSYFFRLKKYLPDVLDFLEQNPSFIVPHSHHKDICVRLRQYIEKDSEDLSISRTKISWGIPIPKEKEEQEQHCLYVWMDALLNYHTGPLHKLGISPLNSSNNAACSSGEGSSNGEGSSTGEGSSSSELSNGEMIHVIGKDILWFHAVIWLAFLRALKFNFPKKIYVHDFIVDKAGQKMSKSIGNVVDPAYLLQKYGTNALRFYLIKETTLGMDMKFSEEALAQSLLSELGSKLGNVVNRVVSIAGKYVEGIIPASTVGSDIVQPFEADSYYDKIFVALNEYRLSQIVEYLQEMIHQTNQHLMKTEIWKIKDKERFKLVGVPLIRTYLEAILIIAQAFEPVLPEISDRIFAALNHTRCKFEKSKFWNQLLEGSKIQTRLILFPPTTPNNP